MSWTDLKPEDPIEVGQQVRAMLPAVLTWTGDTCGTPAFVMGGGVVGGEVFQILSVNKYKAPMLVAMRDTRDYELWVRPSDLHDAQVWRD